MDIGSLTSDVQSALNHLHNIGYCHNGIHLKNVTFGNNGTAVIIDIEFRVPPGTQLPVIMMTESYKGDLESVPELKNDVEQLRSLENGDKSE